MKWINNMTKTQRLVSRLRKSNHNATLSTPTLWALVEDGNLARSSNSVLYIFPSRSKARQVREDLVQAGREIGITRLIAA
jgi:hypothetical protein